MEVMKKALGEEVKKSLKPGEVFVKILKDELVELLGGEKKDLNLNGNPATLMLVGLQGTGKTTMIGKLGLMLRKKHHRKPLLVACDVYRPAAIDQLKQLGKELNIEVYTEGKGNPVEISNNAIKYAKENGFDYVLVDTAGRLHIDEELMGELKNINENIQPHEILLVVDSMTGQDAINVIEGFNNMLPLTGAILTKLDGDTRGGAALSIRHLTNVPIKFVGVSEKMDGIEEFYPERMATRILGMGDLMTMIEKAEEIRRSFFTAQIGKTYDIIIESQTSDGYYTGHTANYIPVKRKLPSYLNGSLVNVKITDITDEDYLIGEII